MSNIKRNEFDLNSINFGNKMVVTYRLDSPSIENQQIDQSTGIPEDPHPDFTKLVKKLMVVYAGNLGFSKDDWLAFHPEKIYVDGVILKMDFDITVEGGQKISVKGTEITMGGYANDLQKETLAYLNGRKRKQGDLFGKNRLIVGQAESEEDEEDEQQNEEAKQSDMEAEADEPAMAAV